MKIIDILFYVTFVSLVFGLPTYLIATNEIIDQGWVVTERISGYTSYKGQLFRYETQNVFYVESFEIIENNGTKLAAINIVDKGTDGGVETITQPVKGANFVFDFNMSGSYPTYFDISPLLIRDVPQTGSYPFNSTEDTFLRSMRCEQINCRFNLDHEPDFFNINFEFVQLVNWSGTIANMTVNVELNTNNLPNGMIERTAAHVIKRDSQGNIVFVKDHSYQIQSVFARYFRVMDQEDLQIPYLLLAIWIVVRIYQKAMKYMEDNGIKLWYKESRSPPDIPIEKEDKK